MAEEKKGIGIFSLVKRVYLAKSVMTRILIAIGLAFFLALLFPRGESIELDFKVGSIWSQKDLIAPFSFPILRDDREYQADVTAAKSSVYEVFERDSAGTEAFLLRTDTFFRQLTETARLRDVALRSERRHTVSAASDSTAFARAASNLAIPFSPAEWEIIGALSSGRRLEGLFALVEDVLREALRLGIIDRAKGTLVRPEIALRHTTTEEIVPHSRLLDQAETVGLLEQRLKERYPDNPGAVDIAYKIGVQFVIPNVHFNRAATDQAVGAAIDAVPRTAGFVQENERIVSKHERITPDIKLKFDSLRRAKAERGPEGSWFFQFVGKMLHVSLLVVLFGIYIYLFRKRIFADNRRLALIAFLILFEGVLAYIAREIDINAPLEYLIFVPVASMLLTITFDSRVGFYGTAIIAALVGGVLGNDYVAAISSLVAGALAVYTVRDVKNRTQIFRSMVFIFIGYGLSILAFDLERFEPTPLIIERLTYALLNAIVSPVLTFGMLIAIERVFGVTTDMTLVELAQFDHPLLRMLAVQAPGTYHHSLSMATLAEAAASSVGANETLARVGAYFHDIGKIEKPGYFVENQRGTRSKHDKISPRISSLIIAAHVKDGVALAREYRLPEEVVDFIPMHHGTTRIDYFYNKAINLARSSSDETKLDEIKESDYRYPGPKPQTKETGIMMLADAIEASVRTIEDPTPQRLEDAIGDIIKQRFEDGELDECPLTLKDLTRIKAAFLNVLVGAYHSRVRYPEVAKPARRARRTIERIPAQEQPFGPKPEESAAGEGVEDSEPEKTP